MTKKSPWEEIRAPDNDLNVRKVKESSSLPLYWGKDCWGLCVFVVELSGDHSEIYRKNVVSVHGIKTDLRHLNTTNNQALVITLEKHIDQDLFFSLCNTLIDSLIDISDPVLGLSIVLSQIKRWKAFMAGRRVKVLTAEEVRGLFSELLFFKEMIKAGYSEAEIINAWQGPESSHQDYIFSNTAVEIKSLSGRERSLVHISSEDQLEKLNDNLFLKIYRLAEIPKSNNTMSLNDLVKDIEEKLQDSEALEKFSEKLAKAGYIEMREYDTPNFIVADERSYRVIHDFPRLIRSQLPEGVTRVGYNIELENIRPFECKNTMVLEKLDGTALK